MRISTPICWMLAATSLFSASLAGAAERVPPELSAKRSGFTSQSTPAPLTYTYTPITPCRAFSKRINADVATSFQITGNGNFGGQGGPATGCGVPAYAKAIAITLSTLNPTITGSLTGYADGTARPGVVSARFNKGQSEATGAIVNLSATGKLALYPSEAVSAIGDVTGYYEPQLWAYVDYEGSTIDSSGRVVSSSKSSTGIYRVNFDRDISVCSGTASSDLAAVIISVFTAGNQASVYVANDAGVPVDYYFNLHIKC